jgi:hypothetical protein
MRRRVRAPSLLPLFFVGLLISIGSAQRENASSVPKTWDDDAIATLEVPLANPIGSPKHVSAEYYYRIPVAPFSRAIPFTRLGVSRTVTLTGSSNRSRKSSGTITGIGRPLSPTATGFGRARWCLTRP